MADRKTIPAYIPEFVLTSPASRIPIKESRPPPVGCAIWISPSISYSTQHCCRSTRLTLLSRAHRRQKAVRVQNDARYKLAPSNRRYASPLSGGGISDAATVSVGELTWIVCDKKLV